MTQPPDPRTLDPEAFMVPEMSEIAMESTTDLDLVVEPDAWYRDPGSVALVLLLCIAVGIIGGVLLSQIV